MSVSLEVDNESALPKLLEGRTIAFLGGPSSKYPTAEAREPSRRNELHDHLLQARQLRASLEDAADRAEALSYNDPSSYSESMYILQSRLGDINKLVRLTEVLRENKHDCVTMGDVREGGAAEGGSAVDEGEGTEKHDEWSEWIENRNAIKEEKRNREKRILRRQLRDFAKEHNPGVEIDNELEGRHDALISKPKQLDSSSALGGAGPEGWTAEGDLYADNGMLSDSSLLEEGNGSDIEYLPQPPSYAESEHDYNTMATAQPQQDLGERQRKGRKSKTRAQVTITDVISQITSNGDELFDEDDMPMRSLARKSSKKRKVVDLQDEGRKNAPIDLTSQTSSLSQDEQQPSQASRMNIHDERHGIMDVKPAAASQPKKKATTSPVASVRKRAPETIASSSFKTVKEGPPEKAKSSTVESSSSARAPRKKSTASAAKSTTPKVRPAKKCHDCKTSTTRYRNCNYYNITGGKCQKRFCIECLQTKYTLGDDVQSPTNPNGIPIENIVLNATYDAEWHCPACLGRCMCKPCVNARKREEERERSRNEARQRKSSRRGGDKGAAGAGNAYGYFY